MGNTQAPCCAHTPHPARPFPAPHCPAGAQRAQHKPLILCQPHRSPQKEPGRTGLPTASGLKGGISLEGGLQADFHGALVPKAAAGLCAAWLPPAPSTPQPCAPTATHSHHLQHQRAAQGPQHRTDVGRALGLGAAQHPGGDDAPQNCWCAAPRCVSRSGPCVCCSVLQVWGMLLEEHTALKTEFPWQNTGEHQHSDCATSSTLAQGFGNVAPGSHVLWVKCDPRRAPLPSCRNGALWAQVCHCPSALTAGSDVGQELSESDPSHSSWEAPSPNIAEQISAWMKGCSPWLLWGPIGYAGCDIPGLSGHPAPPPHRTPM